MLPLLLMAVALLLAGCARAPRTSAPPPASGLAAPVLAPMAARDRLLHDLDAQKQQARERAATFDEARDR